MVWRIEDEIFECEECGEIYEDYYDARECERFDVHEEVTRDRPGRDVRDGIR